MYLSSDLILFTQHHNQPAAIQLSSHYSVPPDPFPPPQEAAAAPGSHCTVTAVTDVTAVTAVTALTVAGPPAPGTLYTVKARGPQRTYCTVTVVTAVTAVTAGGPPGTLARGLGAGVTQN